MKRAVLNLLVSLPFFVAMLYPLGGRRGEASASDQARVDLAGSRPNIVLILSDDMGYGIVLNCLLS